MPKGNERARYIFVVGGVVSGLGKGVVSASIGMLLKSCGYKINMIKIDPYLNIDAGTMRPAEHGEVFVTDDKGEIDQDLGNYERFLNQSFGQDNNITTGKVFQTIIQKERAFEYEGRDVEMIPDVPNEIKRRFYEHESGFDFVIVEVGGTTGDIENLPFLYAAREVGRERRAMYILVSYVPLLKNVGEQKTKPTQHAVMQLRSTGISADMVITRGEVPLDLPRRETLAKRCFLEPRAIIDDPDAETIYDVPLTLESQGLVEQILEHFEIKNRKPKIKDWTNFVKGVKNGKRVVNIALVGKYVQHGTGAHKDVYVSVLEALKHAGVAVGVKVNLIAVDSTNENIVNLKKVKCDGVVIPQGWGSRGTEGKIAAIEQARKIKIPYLGLCFGMQMAVIEYARNKAGLTDANSFEVNPKTKNPVINIMPDQKKYLEEKQYGGTIRLGSWKCVVLKGSVLEDAYKKYGTEPNLINKNIIKERHRHRYEFNNDYRELLEKKGLVISGVSPDGKLVEAIELPKEVHPFFVGTQFHPEYKSRPLSPHPLFVAFLKAAGE